MKFFVFTFILTIIFAAGFSQVRNKYDWITTEEGCRVQNPHPRKGEIAQWTGPCVNGVAEGKGVLTWVTRKETQSFEGTLKFGLPEGNGTMRTGSRIMSGTFHENDLVNGLNITLIKGDTSSVEEGRFENNHLTEGSLIYYDEHKIFRIESGTFVNRQLQGKGTIAYISDDGDTTNFYNGRFKDGELEEGTAEMYDGDYRTILTGSFVKNNLSGPGTYVELHQDKLLKSFEGEFPITDTDGPGKLQVGFNTYEGTFSYGWMTGHTTVYYKDSVVYVGEMKNNAYHGKGQRWYLDGRKHMGYWKDGAPEGFGISLWPDGTCYFGEFSSGLFNGNGILISPETTLSGIWANGSLTGGQSPTTTHEFLQKRYAEDYETFKSQFEFSK